MSSSSLGKNQHDSTWARLPTEIRRLIFKELIEDGCTLSPLTAVSREWQIEFEQRTFCRLRLTPSRLVDFRLMARRNRALVRYIWFCLELDTYDCTKCGATTLSNDEWEEAVTISDTDHCPITTAFQNLFSVLSTWDHDGDLTLDISLYSLSDSEHWFPYLTVMPDTPSDMLEDGGIERAVLSKVRNYQHGWIAGLQDAAPFRAGINKIFHMVMEQGPFVNDELENEWWDQLPSAPAVTHVLLRQQNRRRWKPAALARMFARFPNLGEVCYEPWREWHFIQRHTDRDLQYLFESMSRFNSHLKSLVVFENFNQQYPTVMQRFMNGVDLAECHSIRKPSPQLGRVVALASLKLEHLAASFIVDASHFFRIEPSWVWQDLTSLSLTSTSLSPNEDPAKMESMLQAAAAAALKMPRLEIMEIWNGRKGLAALFKYQVLCNLQQATITWRATWGYTMKQCIVQPWKAVVHQEVGWRLDIVEERLDGAAIKSHADAIRYLDLSRRVIRPISLQQIQVEQKALEGVQAVQ